MGRYIASFWSPGGDYTPPDITAKTPEAAVNKAWLKVPKKYKDGMVRGFTTDLDSDDMDPPAQFEWDGRRWVLIQ